MSGFRKPHGKNWVFGLSPSFQAKHINLWNFLIKIKGVSSVIHKALPTTPEFMLMR